MIIWKSSVQKFLRMNIVYPWNSPPVITQNLGFFQTFRHPTHLLAKENFSIGLSIFICLIT